MHLEQNLEVVCLVLLVGFPNENSCNNYNKFYIFMDELLHLCFHCKNRTKIRVPVKHRLTFVHEF